MHKASNQRLARDCKMVHDKRMTDSFAPRNAASIAAHAAAAIEQTAQPITLQGAELTFYPDIGLAERDTLFTHLANTSPWRQHDIKMFGKVHPQPRLEAWYGDPHAHYSYSGIAHHPTEWTPQLAILRQRVEQLCHCDFNSVLLNYYRNGDDYMGLHADDEPELGPQPVIASLSLGATRRMYFRHKHRPEVPTLSLDLPSGSLLLMAGTTQENWKHGIRKTRRACGPRINLTFRRVAGDPQSLSP